MGAPFGVYDATTRLGAPHATRSLGSSRSSPLINEPTGRE